MRQFFEKNEDSLEAIETLLFRSIEPIFEDDLLNDDVDLKTLSIKNILKNY
jgi:hypothetical protein